MTALHWLLVLLGLADPQRPDPCIWND